MRDNAELLFGRSQQQQPAVGRLIAAVKINCELLAGDGWQVERKRRSVGHGRSVSRRRKHARLDNGLLRDLNELRHGQRNIVHA